MSVPGSNLLNRAARLIKQQTVIYYSNNGRSLNDVGQYVTSYAPTANVQGSLQPVTLEVMQQYGLDFGKKYVTFYTSNPVLGLQRDVSGDMFVYAGTTYQCVQPVNWFPIDGWNGVIAITTELEPPETDTFVITPQGNFIIDPQ